MMEASHSSFSSSSSFCSCVDNFSFFLPSTHPRKKSSIPSSSSSSSSFLLLFFLFFPGFLTFVLSLISFSSAVVQGAWHAPGDHHDLSPEDVVEVCEGRILLKRPTSLSSSDRGRDEGSLNEEEEEEEDKIDFSSVVVSLLVDGVVREQEVSTGKKRENEQKKKKIDKLDS